MDAYVVIVFVFGVLILAILSLLYFYNLVVVQSRKVVAQFENVQKYVQEERNLISLMCAFLKKSLVHEEDYLKKLTDAAEVLGQLRYDGDQVEAFSFAENTYQEFYRLDKVYPKLEKNAEYLSLRNEAQVCQERLFYALDSYREMVHAYWRMDEKKIFFFIKKVSRFPRFCVFGE